MKAESHTLNPPAVIEHRIISYYRPVCTVLYTQGPINPDSTKLNREFHKGGIGEMCIHTTRDFVRLKVLSQG